MARTKSEIKNRQFCVCKHCLDQFSSRFELGKHYKQYPNHRDPKPENEEKVKQMKENFKKSPNETIEKHEIKNNQLSGIELRKVAIKSGIPYATAARIDELKVLVGSERNSTDYTNTLNTIRGRLKKPKSTKLPIKYQGEVEAEAPAIFTERKLKFCPCCGYPVEKIEEAMAFLEQMGRIR
jgi:hypothetical protein